MKTVIMAGGLGSRLQSAYPALPKPMIPAAGKPILQRQIERLAENGFRDILLVTGYKKEKIREYFGDGNGFGVSLSYYEEETPLGSGGALFRLLDNAGGGGDLGEEFLLVNGDLVFDLDLRRLLEFHREKNALATLVSHPNNHPFDSSLLVLDAEDRVKGWLAKEEKRVFYHNCVNAGIHIFTQELLQKAQKKVGFPAYTKIDIDRDILIPCLSEGRIFAYKTSEYIKDAGTVERLFQAESDIKSGFVRKRSLKNRQKAFFLDRDGTINRETGFLTSPAEFALEHGATEAVKKINSSGSLAIVVTNQPVIARGDLSEEGLDVIHQKMEACLGKEGAFLDGIFYCPHHPERGFPGERPKYKIECECRKPKPGLLLAAARKYNIDLASSWMIGDCWRDIGAGKAASCKTALISTSEAEFRESGADIFAASLFDAVMQIESQEGL